METDWNRALRASISEVFSTMFFMVPEWDPELTLRVGGMKAGGWLEGLVELTKASQVIRVWVWSPPEVAADLAANILASDPKKLNKEEILDAFREMLNMVAGSLLTRMDPAGQWRMGLPQARELGPTSVKDLLRQVQEELAFEADDRPFLAGLNLVQG